MSQSLEQQILSRSDYHRGLLIFIESNPGCTEEDMFNSPVANALIPIGIRELAIELWVDKLIADGHIQEKSGKLYSSDSASWQDHNIVRENRMKITKRHLKKAIRKVIRESKSFPWYESQQPDYPYTHGYGGYGGSHSTIFGNIRDHEEDEPGVIDMIIDWCHEVESLYKDAFDEFEENLYADFGMNDRHPEYKEQSRKWYDEHRADWASRYSESGASEVIPQRVWDSLFDYIIEDYMTPREFLDKISSSMR